MKILAIDTSMQACSTALLNKDSEGAVHLSGCYEEIERGHAERLMAMIDEVLIKAGTTVQQVDHFAVSRGPGTFTGVRIGIAAARGLALACGKPLIGIGTLDVLAARVLQENAMQNMSEQNSHQSNLGIAIDARRGEIYWQLFDPSGQALGEAIAQTPETIADFIMHFEKTLCLAGSGATHITDILDKEARDYSCSHPQLQPNAIHLAELVANSPDKDNLSSHSSSPLYLRPADAKIQTGFAIERQ